MNVKDLEYYVFVNGKLVGSFYTYQLAEFCSKKIAEHYAQIGVNLTIIIVEVGE